MADAYAEHQRRSLYNSPSSIAGRAKPPAPGPVAQTRARHREETAEMGRRHRAESVKLNQHVIQESSRRELVGQHPFPKSDPRSPESQRDKLHARHDRERSAMVTRHRAELEHVARQHPRD